MFGHPDPGIGVDGGDPWLTRKVPGQGGPLPPVRCENAVGSAGTRQYRTRRVDGASIVS